MILIDNSENEVSGLCSNNQINFKSNIFHQIEHNCVSKRTLQQTNKLHSAEQVPDCSTAVQP